MSKVYKAKLFPNGGSQAVRIPAEFRFSNDEVFITYNPETESVVISAKKPDWKKDFRRIQKLLTGKFTSLDLEILSSRDQPPMALADFPTGLGDSNVDA